MAHQKTHTCICNAEKLLEESSPDSLRYAALQLRMAIEYLFYELIPLYQEELPDDITSSTWQPRQIIDALLECNPYVDQDAQIRIGDGSSAMVFESKAPNRRLLKQHYHRLGSYLHAPVNLLDPQAEKWQSDLREAILCLRQFDTEQILHNIRPLVTFSCQLCGRVVKRNKHGVEASGEMRCPNPKCMAIYDIRLEPDRFCYALRKVDYKCLYCGALNNASAGGIQEGIIIDCKACGKRAIVRLGYCEAIE